MHPEALSQPSKPRLHIFAPEPGREGGYKQTQLRGWLYWRERNAGYSRVIFPRTALDNGPWDGLYISRRCSIYTGFCVVTQELVDDVMQTLQVYARGQGPRRAAAASGPRDELKLTLLDMSPRENENSSRVPRNEAWASLGSTVYGGELVCRRSVG